MYMNGYTESVEWVGFVGVQEFECVSSHVRIHPVTGMYAHTYAARWCPLRINRSNGDSVTARLRKR